MATRRERLRAATITDIKEAARDLLHAGGKDEVTLRGVARALDMSAPGLYRYYDCRSTLLTALIADAFNDLGDAVEAAEAATREQPVGDRLLAAARAYRGWAVVHPHEFGLIYGDPLPGYAAPPEGPTVVAVRRGGAVFVRLYTEAWRTGLLVRPAGAPATPDGLDEALGAAQLGDELPPWARLVLVGAYARMHGMVVLEVFHHLAWLTADPSDLFDATLRGEMAGLGLPSTAPAASAGRHRPVTLSP